MRTRHTAVALQFCLGFAEVEVPKTGFRLFDLRVSRRIGTNTVMAANKRPKAACNRAVVGFGAFCAIAAALRQTRAM
jgi:hypothetical protein